MEEVQQREGTRLDRGDVCLKSASPDLQMNKQGSYGGKPQALTKIQVL